MSGTGSDDVRAPARRLARWLVDGDPAETSPPAGPPLEAFVEAALAGLEPDAGLHGDCADVSDCLADYAVLGEQAAGRMPSIRRHLEGCEACLAELAVLSRVHADRESWRHVAAVIGEPASRLVLAHGTWNWLVERGRRLVPVSSEDFARARRVAGWRLQPRPAVALSFQQARSSLPHVDLVTDVEGLAVPIRLALTAEFLPTVHAADWRVRVELGPEAAVPPLRVGLGDAERATCGWRTLAPDRPAEFHVDPAGSSGYRLHLEWYDPRGQRVRRVVEVPLVSAEDDAR